MALSGPSRTDVNRSAAMAFLGSHGPASRADLARRLGVSPALITQLTRDLIADGLVAERETAKSEGGRPARMLALATSAAHAIGIKVVADHIAFVEVGLDGSVIRSDTRPFDASSVMATTELSQLASEFVDASASTRLLGVGVGVPGTVDDQGIGIVDSTQLGWVQVPVGATLRAAVGLPVVVENNVNALSVAERLFGRGQDHPDFLVVTIGTGIGAGIVSGETILRGRAGGAGDLGHVPVTDGGPLCQCGNTGCLEAYIGEPALLASARAVGVLAEGDGIARLIAAAGDGDSRATGILADAGRMLGRTLAGVVNVLAPQLVVILGEGVVGWRFWAPTFEAAFRASLVPGKRGTEVAIESWQDERWAQGAAALALATSFDTEGVTGEQGRLMRARLALAAEPAVLS